MRAGQPLPCDARRGARRWSVAGFVEVFVDTPLEVVQARDVKGLYAGAQRGEVKAMTGVSDPYEPPIHAELRLNTVGHSAADNAARIIEYLDGRRLLGRR